MPGWAITLFLLALGAAVFGFGGLSAAFADIVQILFFVITVLLVVTLIARRLSGPTTELTIPAHLTSGDFYE